MVKRLIGILLAAAVVALIVIVVLRRDKFQSMIQRGELIDLPALPAAEPVIERDKPAMPRDTTTRPDTVR